jgi:predicted component of type VI protein secretion system
MFATNKIQSAAGLTIMLLAGVLFTGCFMSEDDQDMHPARVTVEMNLGASDSVAKTGTLGKTTGEVARHMVVLMTSNKNDTVCDTITSRGAQISKDGTFLASSTTTAQTVVAHYELAPHRKWKIAVKVLDTNDSLWYSGTSTVEGLKAFEYRTVGMSCDSRFAAYTARFALPASVRVTGAVSARQVYFTRLTLSVDGAIVHDSVVTAVAGTLGSAAFQAADPARLPGSAGKRFFKPVTNSSYIALTHDYVQAGSHEFTLAAYGYLEGDTVGVTQPRLLFQGARNLGSALGKVASEDAVTLDWKATDAATLDAGNVGLVVKLGKINAVVVTAITSGAIDF